MDPDMQQSGPDTFGASQAQKGALSTQQPGLLDATEANEQTVQMLVSSDQVFPAAHVDQAMLKSRLRLLTLAAQSPLILGLQCCSANSLQAGYRSPTVFGTVQVSKLVKLLANKGRKKQEIVAATGCCILIPATEDWDDDSGVTITFTGGNTAKAQQLVLKFLS